MANDVNAIISVIIPIFNMGKYLPQCLDSVIAQNLKNIEILCVNDGSTDSSEDIIKSYMKNDHRIKLISQTNQGVASARNNAMRQAHGEFIAFMDPDDWYPDANVLALLYNKAKESGMSIVGGSFSEWTGGKLVTEFTGIKRKYTFKHDGIVAYRNYQFDYGYHRFIYRTSFLRENNIYFPPYIRFQDPPFFVTAMVTAGEFYAVHNVTYCYRVGTQQIVWTEKKLIDLLKGLRDLLNITSAYRLKELHCLSLQRLGKNYASRYADILLNASNELHQTLKSVEKSVDISLISGDKELMHYRYIYSYLLELAQSYNQQAAPILTKVNRQMCEGGGKKETQNLISLEKVEQSKNRPCVSVIIPIFNVENYVEACVKSVCTQTLKDIEIILVNDGTPDRSMDRVSSLVASDARIKVIDKENGGLSSARNAGIKVATGEYLLFLDSDDLLYDTALERLYYHAKKTNLEDLFYNAESFFENLQSQENNPNYIDYYKRDGDYTGVWKGTVFFTKLILNRDFKPSACLQLISRDFLKKNDLSFYEGIIHEDNLFTMQCLLKADRTGYLNEALYRRRVHENSIMTQRRGISNALGYYTGVFQMLKSVTTYTKVLEEPYLEQLIYYLGVMVDTGSNYIKGLSAYQLANYTHNLSPTERILFNLLLVKTSYLKQEFQQVRQELSQAKKERQQAKKEAQQINTLRGTKEIQALQREVHTLKEEVDALKKSESYRLGLLILFIPRKIRGCIRCYRENGLRYTIRRLGQKLKLVH